MGAACGGDPMRSLSPELEDTIVMGISIHSAIAGIPAGLLQGSLVFLPRAASLPSLARLRSPGWMILLPGSILVGTFGLLLIPSMAFGVVFLAAGDDACAGVDGARAPVVVGGLVM